MNVTHAAPPIIGSIVLGFQFERLLTDAFASGKEMVMTAAPDMRESN
jgi:hypothetical protein